eukprot:Polyplicarium_translucidae@DN2334_c0_g1_i2.p1
MSLPGLGMGSAQGAPPQDAPLPDTSEQVCISSLALLKMLKHGRAGVPMEVMGLMLGEFTDDYTIKVVDVFSMPQSGNTVSVEAVDPAYQAEMLEMLKRTNRPEIVVGWYHSHPGFGCWFSGTDVNTQQSFEQLNSRAVGVVVDPIQSVKGKVVIDCFRLITPHLLMFGHEPRQTTSNIGHLTRPSITALVHGLNRHYYSIVINYKKSEEEQKMLLNLHKRKWGESLKLKSYTEFHSQSNANMAELMSLSGKLVKDLQEELVKTPEELVVSKAGKIDAKRRLEAEVHNLVSDTILHSITSVVSANVF